MSVEGMMIPADLDSIKRMLGCDDNSIPKIIRREYQIRLRMFHCNGNSGALGTLGLIDMLRSLKYGPAVPVDPPKYIDWTRVPTDGSVHVEAKTPAYEKVMGHMGRNGSEHWRPGVYVGRVGVGSLAVRLDGNQYVGEFAARDVRIPSAATEPEEDPADTPVVLKAEPEPEDLVPLVPPSPKGNPLDRAVDGDPVWVEDRGDLVDGVFKGRNEHGVLIVVVGEPCARAFPPEKVIYAKS